MTTDPMTVVTVGVDGSDESKEALRWAADYARALHCRLQVIGAWQYPASYYGYAVALQDDDLGKETEKLVRDAVGEVLGDTSDLSTDVRIMTGPAAHLLVALSEESDLLVVGSRGHGAFSGMLLGSVSNYCVHHAGCPVVVVRAKQETA